SPVGRERLRAHPRAGLAHLRRGGVAAGGAADVDRLSGRTHHRLPGKRRAQLQYRRGDREILHEGHEETRRKTRPCRRGADSSLRLDPLLFLLRVLRVLRGGLNTMTTTAPVPTRKLVYSLLITVAAGAVAGRILATELVVEPSLHDLERGGPKGRVWPTV